MGDDRASAREENGLIIYRASALGGCLRALVASRLGFVQMPAPRFIQGKYDEGHSAEDVVVEKLKKEHGIPVVGRQIETITHITEKVKVVGHIDGMVMGKNQLVEIKSQTDLEWDKFEKDGWNSGLFPRYQWQLSSYFHSNYAFDDCLFVRYNRDTGRISKELITKPFYSLAHIRSRVLGAESYVADGVVPETCDVMMYPCPVYYLHEETDREELAEETRELAIAYKKAQTAEKVAKQEKDELRRVLREAAGSKRKLSGDGVRVTFYDVKWRTEKKVLGPLECLAVSIGKGLAELGKIDGKQERLRVSVEDEFGKVEEG